MRPSFDSLRLLELGDRALFSEVFPENTQLLWTGNPAIAPTPRQRNFTPASALSLARALRTAQFDLVICHAPLHNPLRLRRILRLLGRHPLLFPAALHRHCGFLFLHLPSRTPLVVLDNEDYSGVLPHNFFLFPRCRRYFKRELPPDHWKIFSRTAHSDVPNPRFRTRRRFATAVERLRPLSLGLSEKKRQQIEALALETRPKVTDLFFAGATGNSSVRQQGLALLHRLRERGYRVDIAEPNLPAAAYFERTAAAWLTWSPEGLGWDCFRHYEAAACGSVPVMNYPTIHRYRPFEHQVHGLYYRVEGNGLAETVERALEDRARLQMMGQDARAFVLQYHTQRRLCEYVLEEGLFSGDATL